MGFFRSVRRFAAHGVDMGPQVTMPGGLKCHSARGNYSSAIFREKFYMHLKMTTDPFLQDFFFKRAVFQLSCDPNMYPMYGLCSLSFGIMVGSLMRHMLFNPDVYFRRQENKKPMPDRVRQFTYALPFYNHQLKNWCAKYRWQFIDNEPDYADAHPGGLRPYRQQSPYMCYSFGISMPFGRYTTDDPMYTTVSHKNMCDIYAKAGYAHVPVEEE
jgi:hypothetical protein